MKPDEELAALWHWLEPMCAVVPAPLCYICKGTTKLVQPENLFYVCPECFPATHSWEF